MAVIDGIGLAEPSTITKSLAAIPITRNSSVTYQEAMVLASPNSTTLLALAEVTGSTPASTTVGLVVRQPMPTLVTVTSTSGTDTTATLVSSAATTPRIVAYSVTSTAAGPIRAGFYAGSTLLWPVLLWADGGIAQVSEAVPAPAYIFSGQADRPVQFSQGSTGHVTIGLTYYQQ